MDDFTGMFLGDARHIGARLAEAAALANPAEPGLPILTATVTSPPYSDLIDYGTSGQIGFGQSEAEYLEDCRKVFESLYRWTKSNGVLWLVAESHLERGRASAGVSRLNPLPFKLAALAESTGWILREVVIWHKDRTRPWTHKGKFRKSFEHVLLLVKGPEYKFYADRLRESGDLTRWWVQYPERYNSLGKAPENVWDIPIPVQGSWGKKSYQHACPLPPELVRRLILLSSDEDDIICDPFAGIGTVPGVATALKRRTIASDINPQFVDHYEKHLRAEVRDLVEESLALGASGPTPQTIVTLRLLKLPKVAVNKLKALAGDMPGPSHVIVDVDQTSRLSADGKLGAASWYFVLPNSTAEVRAATKSALEGIAGKPPLSKFQVSGDIEVIDEAEASELLGEAHWNVYEDGHTWTSTQDLSGRDFLRLGSSTKRGQYPPIASNVKLSVVLRESGRMY